MMTSFLVNNVCCVYKQNVCCVHFQHKAKSLLRSELLALDATRTFDTHIFIECHKCKALPKTCSLSHENLQFVRATWILAFRQQIVSKLQCPDSE